MHVQWIRDTLAYGVAGRSAIGAATGFSFFGCAPAVVSLTHDLQAIALRYKNTCQGAMSSRRAGFPFA